jgi:hypothetical protein
MKQPYHWFVVSILLILILACNLPSSAPTLRPSPQAASSSASNPTATLQASTSAPADTPTSTVTHLTTPADLNTKGTLNYDVDSSGTASDHRAPYGDSYNINLFERPFTQKDMSYVPSLDINTFQITSDDNFYYVFITLIGNQPNDPINIDYGVEIDKNHDGFGDVLVWAQPPYTTQWTTNGVKVYTDPNHDTGGASAEKSDANATTVAPYPGDGYETVIFDSGKGEDADLAWVRIDPKNANVIDFAFKKSLAGTSFMWGAWADAGLKNPSMFNYNDRFTPAQAGSPVASSQYYPINMIYAVDNTCRAAYGFKPTGYEPGLCPTNAPPSKPGGPPQPACPVSPPPSCQPPAFWFGPPTCYCEQPPQ